MSERVAIDRQWVRSWIGSLQSLARTGILNDVICDLESVARAPAISTLTEPGVVVEKAELRAMAERLRDAENASRADARVVCHEAIQETIRQVNRLREKEANGIALTAENVALASGYKWEWKSPSTPPQSGQFVIAIVKTAGMEPQMRLVMANPAHPNGAWTEAGKKLEVLGWIELPERPTELL